MAREVLAFGDVGDIDVEAKFDAQISGSHQMVSQVDILFDGETVAEDVPIESGSVSWDRGQLISGSCTLTLADPTRVPVSSSDLLTPYGFEVRVWRGVVVPGGKLMCPLGVFPIQSSSVDGRTILSSVSAMDRSKKVSDADFEDVYQISYGTNFADAVKDIISDAVPGTEFVFPTTPFNAPTLTFGPEDDRLESARKMVQSIGNELLYDGLGRCVMRPEPTFKDVPDGYLEEGVNLLGLVVELDRSSAYNRVVAESSNASLSEPLRGEAIDDNPDSPTYYYGPFGKVTRKYSSPFLSTEAQCVSAANALLAADLGVTRSVSFTALVDPRRETSDVVNVKRDAVGVDELHIVDRLTMGLKAGDVMQGSVRAQQVAQ